MRRRARAEPAGCATCGQPCGYEPDQCEAIRYVRDRRQRWEQEAQVRRALPTSVARDRALDTLPAWTAEHPTLGWEIELWALGAATTTAPQAEVRFRVIAGPLQDRPMILTDRQLRFLLWWYALDDVGDWLMSGASIRHARGTGKSPAAGFVACVELVGPCRPVKDLGGALKLDADGQPIGRRVSMPVVQIAAVSEAQCENIMQYVRGWTSRGSALQIEYNLDPKQLIVHSPGAPGIAAGSLRVLTSSAATARGATPTCVLCDEVGEWLPTNGGVKFRERIDENASKVDGGRVIECSNCWIPGVGSVAQTRWETWEEQQEGDVPPEFPWLMDVREAPADTDWSDYDSILVGLEAVYADVPWIKLKQIMAKVMDPARPIQASMREYGNLRVSDLSSWVSTQGWDQCADPEAVAAVAAAPALARDAAFNRHAAALAHGDEIVLFLDPSETDDATAVVACRMSDGLIVPLWVHEPNAISPTGAPYGRVWPGEIDRRIVTAFDRYKVIAFRSDVHPIEQLSRNDWHDRYAKQLVWWSSKTEAVAYDMRSKGLEFAKACGLVAAEIEAGDLRHTGDKVLGRHVGNSQRRPYRLSEFIGIGKGDRARKIDAAVAMVGARDLRRLVLLSDEWRKYDKRRDRVKREKRAIVLK